MDHALPSIAATTEGLVRLDRTPAPSPPAAAAQRETATQAPATLGSDGAIELLRLQVPAALRQIWLEAERAIWEPWLLRQPGFQGRELFWDPWQEQGVLLIRWACRQQWHAIPAAEVSRVHQAFQQRARALLRRAGHPVAAEADGTTADCFPLLFSGEAQAERSLTQPG